MSYISDLFDDFETVGLDESKWGNWEGDVEQLTAGGLRLGVGTVANEYTVVSSSEYYDLTNSTVYLRVDSMVSVSGTGTAGFYMTRSDGGFLGFTGDGTSLYMERREDSGSSAVVVETLPWSATEYKWWRIRHSSLSNTVFWDTSRDGSSWINRTSYAIGAFAITAMRAEFQSGFTDGGSPGSGDFTVRYFNTRQSISRGPGYLTENFDHLRQAALPYNVSWGPLRLLDNGGGSNVQIISLGALSMDMPVTGFGVVRTDLKDTIADVDITVDVKLYDHGDRAGDDLDSDTPRISWQVQGTTTYSTRYEVSIFKDYALVWRVVSGTSTLVRHISLGTTFGVTYRWRIVHVGTLLTIYRDGGDFTSTGRVTTVTEIARITGATALGAGHIALMAFSCHVEFDNLHIEPGVVPASAPRTFPMKARTWGAFVGGEGAITAPGASVITTPQLLYYLESDVSKHFDVVSWFLDQDLPWSTYAAGAAEFANAGRSNLISWGPTGWHFADILAGTHDSYLQEFAEGVAALATTTHIRLMPEMNGSWSPWSVGFDAVTNGIDPTDDCEAASYAQWILVWKYIITKFRAHGASTAKVKWQFCVNETDEPRSNAMDMYYPGADWVDTLAFDAYNWGDSYKGASFVWRTHEEVLRDMYLRLCGLNSTKHIWLSEIGSKEPTLDDGQIGFTPDPCTILITAVASDDVYVANAGIAAAQGVYSAQARIAPVTTERTARLVIVHYDSGGSPIQYTPGDDVTLSTSVVTTITSPNVTLNVGATKIGLQVVVVGATAAETFSMQYAEICLGAAVGGTNLLPLDDAEFVADEGTWANAYNSTVAYVLGRAPVDPDHSKGTWVTAFMDETSYARITTICWFNIKKERDWRMQSSASSLQAFITGFAFGSVTQELEDLDPIYNPLPIAYGWDAIHPVGLVEYMRLEETGYTPLQIEPSYGGIWLAGFDMGAATPREAVEEAPQRSGTFDYTRYHGSKSITLGLQVVPYLNASVPYMADLIARWMQPRRRPTLVYKPYGSPERSIAVRARNFNHPIALNVRAYGTVDVQFIAIDGVEIDTETQSSTITVNAGATNVITRGTTEAYPVIRLNGPLTNPVIYNETLDTEGNARLGFNMVIDAGQFLEIDVKARTVQLNGWSDSSANRRSLLTERRWFTLIPFDNYIRLDADAGTGTAEITYSNTWL